jgi:hypothetical protein
VKAASASRLSQVRRLPSPVGVGLLLPVGVSSAAGRDRTTAEPEERTDGREEGVAQLGSVCVWVRGNRGLYPADHDRDANAGGKVEVRSAEYPCDPFRVVGATGGHRGVGEGGVT